MGSPRDGQVAAGDSGSSAGEQGRARRDSFVANLEATRSKSWGQLLRDRAKVLVPVLLVFVGTILIVSLLLKEQVIWLFEWAQDNTPISVVYYTLFMALWIICFLSKSLLSTAGGFVFGFWYGFLGSVVGMMLGLAGTILLVRTVFTWCGWRQRLRAYLLREYLEVRVINDMMKTEPFRAILLIKMSLLPTWLKSYSLATIDAPTGWHLLAQLISGSFYSALYVYLGTAASSIVEAVSGKGGVSVESIVINVVGVLMTAAVLLFVRYKMKKAIREAERKMEQSHAAPAIGPTGADKPDVEAPPTSFRLAHDEPTH
jgi:uncharacterized membrane protein YdjX (TVP38/TMEM64 family)